MRIIKPSKRPGKGQLTRQAVSTDDAFDSVSINEIQSDAFSSFEEKNSKRGRSGRKKRRGKYIGSGGKGEREESIVNSCSAAIFHEKEDSSKAVLEVDERKKAFKELMSKAVRLLAMREHSKKELTDKLLAKSDSSDIVSSVIEELIAEGYLSDERFAESYVRFRGARGFGPIKIRSELKNKGVDSALIDDYVESGSARWYDLAADQYNKKFRNETISDYKEWSKRARFLQGRGFTMDHIHSVVPNVEYD